MKDSRSAKGGLVSETEQYGSWLEERCKELEAENERLKGLVKSCAVIFERRIPVTTGFIEELRKAAEVVAREASQN